MARFDLYPNANDDGYLLDVQSDLLSDLNTRVVVPMIPIAKAPTPAKRLNPVVDIDGSLYVMVTQFMAAVPASMLKTASANMSDSSEGVTNALDMVFVGF